MFEHKESMEMLSTYNRQTVNVNELVKFRYSNLGCKSKRGLRKV